jgi:hypothetical protein
MSEQVGSELFLQKKSKNGKRSKQCYESSRDLSAQMNYIIAMTLVNLRLISLFTVFVDPTFCAH